MTDTKPRPATLMPMRIMGMGLSVSLRTTSWLRISAMPTMPSALPAVRAPASGLMPSWSITKNPTAIWLADTVNRAVKAVIMGRRRRGSVSRLRPPRRPPAGGGASGRYFHSATSPSRGSSVVR